MGPPILDCPDGPQGTRSLAISPSAKSSSQRPGLRKAPKPPRALTSLLQRDTLERPHYYELVEKLRVVTKTVILGLLLGGVPMICGLVIHGLWNSPEPPICGERFEVVIQSFGEPGAVHTASTESKVFGDSWCREADDKWIPSTSLPPVKEKRLFYSKGFMGTVHYLIYVEDGSVTDIFWRST